MGALRILSHSFGLVLIHSEIEKSHMEDYPCLDAYRPNSYSAWLAIVIANIFLLGTTELDPYQPIDTFSVRMINVGAASLDISVLNVRRNQRLVLARFSILLLRNTWRCKSLERPPLAIGNAPIYILGLPIVNLTTLDLNIARARRRGTPTSGTARYATIDIHWHPSQRLDFSAIYIVQTLEWRRSAD